VETPKTFETLKKQIVLFPIFFYLNVICFSAANSSDLRRYALITAVNAKSNEPFKEHHHPKYHKMVKLDNDAILQCHR
jgi:ectoine hydroxylase